jgi:hypothetical protein
MPSETSAFQNWLGFVNCGAAQQAKLQQAGTFLSDRLYEAGGWRMYQCLDDAFLSNVNGHRTASEILDQLRTPGQTIIECTDSFHDECGNGHEWLGCAHVGISGERLEIANHFLLDPNVSEVAIAGVIAHEIAHNRGHRHGGLGPGEYDLTANQQVRACVSNLAPSGEPDPFGPRRSSIPAEVELGPAGHMGGAPFEQACRGSAFGNGLRIGHGSLADSLALHCTDGITRGPAGNASHQPVADHVCSPGEVLVGVHGRSGALIDQLGAICAPSNALNNPHARRIFGPVGGDGGWYFASACPLDMAVRQIRGRAGNVIDRVQVVCETFSQHTFSSAHTPHATGTSVGGAGGTRMQLQCAGKGGMQALVGRSDDLVDRLSAVCQPTQGFDPVVLVGPHHTLPFAGGRGGAEFVNGCQSHELMVGLTVRSGKLIDAVQPVCADAVSWDRDWQTSRRPTGVWSGGTGGTEHTLLCPSFQFVVGLNISAGSLIDRLQLVCRDLR